MPTDPKQIIQKATSEGKSPEFIAELKSKLGVVDQEINLPRNLELKNERERLVAKLKKDNMNDEFSRQVLKKFDTDANYAKNESDLKKQEEYKSAMLELQRIRPDLGEQPTKEEYHEGKTVPDIKETHNIYDKGLSKGELEQVEKKKEEQELFDQGLAPAELSIINTVTNALGQLSTIDDRVKYAYGVFANDPKAIGEAETVLRKQEQIHSSATIGFTDLTDYKGNKLLGFTAAGFNALSQFGVSMAQQSLTPGGIGLWADIVASSVRDHNKARAEELGVSVEELVDTGQAGYVTPLATAGVVYALEKWGLDKASGKTTSKLISKMSNNAWKVFAKIAEGGVIEGGTEWIQGAFEEYNKLAVRDGEYFDLEAGGKALEWLVSKEGLETLYQGAFGGKGIRSVSATRELISDRRADSDKKTIDEQNKIIQSLEKQKNNPNISKEELASLEEAQESAREKRDEAIINPYKDLINVSNEGIRHIKDLNDARTEVIQKILEMEKSENLDEDTKALAIKQLEEKARALENQALAIVAMSNAQVEQKKESRLDKIRSMIKDRQKPKKNADGTPKKDTRSTFEKKQEEEGAVAKEEAKLEKEQENLEGNAIGEVDKKMRETEKPGELVERELFSTDEIEKAEATEKQVAEELSDLRVKKDKGEITQEEYTKAVNDAIARAKEANDVLYDKYGNRKQNLFNPDGSLNEESYKFNKSLKDELYQPGGEEVSDPEGAEKVAEGLVANIKKAIPGVSVKFGQKKRGQNESHYDPTTNTIFIDTGALTKKGASKVLEDLFHEGGHAWTEMIRQSNPELLTEIERMVLNDKEFQKFYVDSRKEGHPYSHLTERQLAEEYVQRIVGVRGAAFIKSNPNLTKSAKGRLIELIQKMWTYFANKLGIQNRPGTVEDLANIVVASMITGQQFDSDSLLKRVRENRILKKTNDSQAKVKRQVKAKKTAAEMDPMFKWKQDKLKEDRGIVYEDIVNDPSLEQFDMSDPKTKSDVYTLENNRNKVAQALFGANWNQLDAKTERTIVDAEVHARLQARNPNRVVTPLIAMRQLARTKGQKILYVADSRAHGEVGIAVAPHHKKPGVDLAITAFVDPLIDGYTGKRIEYDVKALKKSTKLSLKEQDMVRESVEKATELKLTETKKYEAKPMTQEEAATLAKATLAEQKALMDKVDKLLSEKKAKLAKVSGKAKFLVEVDNEVIINGLASAIKDIKGGESLANVLIRIGKNISPKETVQSQAEATVEKAIAKEEAKTGEPLTEEQLQQDAKFSVEAEKLRIYGVAGSIALDQLRLADLTDLDVGWRKDDPITLEIVDQHGFNVFVTGAGFAKTETKYEKPQFSEPEGFTGFMHSLGLPLFKKSTNEGKKQPKKVYDVINRAIKTPQNIDTEWLTVLENLKDKLKPENPSQLRLFQEVLNRGRAINDKTYYSMYRYDFRGRIYSAMNYLNHQGSEMAKSMVRVGKPVALGVGGWKWLMIQATDTLGADEVTLEDRFQYADANLAKWMKWAADPVGTYEQWGSVAEPFIFMATLMEIKRALDSGSPLAYESNMAVQMDATTSGPQIMIAITRDEKGAPIVNLTESQDRGDLYTEAGNRIQQWMKEDQPENSKETLTKVLNNLQKLDPKNFTSKQKKEMTQEQYQEAISKFYEYVQSPEFRADKVIATKEFLSRPEVLSKFRKLMKGPTMTKYYSAGDKKIAAALVKSFQGKEGFEGFNYSFAFELAKKITSELDNILVGPGKLMNALVGIGNALAKKGIPLQYKLPVSGFNMVQNPKARVTSKFRIPYEGSNKNILAQNTTGVLNLAFNFTDKDIMDLAKVASSTAPNLIHSMDAQIPAWLYLNTDMDILTIHDSFGTVAGRAEEMYNSVREGFVDIFGKDSNVLEDLFDQTIGKNQEALGYSDKMLAKKQENFLSLVGNFDINGIKKNEYAFSAGVGIVRSGKLTDKQKFEAEDSLMKEVQENNLKTQADKILEESQDCK